MPKIQMLPEIQAMLDKWQLVMTPLKEPGIPFTKEEDLKDFNRETGETDYKNNRELYTQNAARLLDYFVFYSPDVIKNIVFQYENSMWGKGAAAAAVQSQCSKYINPAAYYLDYNTCVPFITSEKLYQKMQWMEWVLTHAQDYITKHSGNLSWVFTAAAKKFITTRLPATTTRLNEYAKAHHLPRLSVDELEQQFDAEQNAKASAAVVEDAKDDEYVEVKVADKAPQVEPEATTAIAEPVAEAAPPSAEPAAIIVASAATTLSINEQEQKSDTEQNAKAKAVVEYEEYVEEEEEEILSPNDHHEEMTKLEAEIEAEIKATKKHIEAVRLKREEIANRIPSNTENANAGWGKTFSTYLSFKKPEETDKTAEINQKRLAALSKTHEFYVKQLQELETKLNLAKPHHEEILSEYEEMHDEDEEKYADEVKLPDAKEKSSAVASISITHNEDEEKHADEVKLSEAEEKSSALASTSMARDKHESAVEPKLNISIARADAPNPAAAPASPVEHIAPAPFEPVNDRENCIRELNDYIDQRQAEFERTKKAYHSIFGSLTGCPAPTKITAAGNFIKLLEGKKTHFFAEHIAALKTGRLKDIIQKYENKLLLPLEFIDTNNMVMCKERLIQALENYIIKRHGSSIQAKTHYYHFWSRGLGYAAPNKTVSADKMIHLLEGKMQDKNGQPIVLTDEDVGALRQGELGRIIKLYEKHFDLPYAFTAAESHRVIHGSAALKRNNRPV